MNSYSADDDVMREILKDSRTIAVVGISDKPERSSYGVAEYLQRHFRVIPVNPMLSSWKGEKCYPSLLDIPAGIQVDTVNIFRRSELVEPIVDEAISRGIPNIWMQLGVINLDAATRAQASGIRVVMDACIAVVHSEFSRNT